MEPYNETTNPALTGILGRCPRCQQGSLFSGLIALAPKCEVCGYSFADPADGPAFFSMTIVAFPALAFALWLQFTYEPPIWVHLLVTLPLTVGACLFLLRPLKGWLAARSSFTRRKKARLTMNGTPQKQNGVAISLRINRDIARIIEV
jgi:uncharacterized protein (DUF983 family)